MAAEEGPPELSVQEAASCSVSPSLSSALPLRESPSCVHTLIRPLHPNPSEHSCPETGFRVRCTPTASIPMLDHSALLVQDKLPQRWRLCRGRGRCSPSLLAAQGGAFPIPLPGSNAPTKDNYSRKRAATGGLQTGPAGAWAEDSPRPLAASLSLPPGRFVLQAGPQFSAQLAHARPQVWARLRRPPVLSPKLLPGARGGSAAAPAVAAVRPLGPCLSRLPAVRVLGRQAGTTVPSSTAAPRPHHPTRHRCFKESGVTPSTSSELK